jgi:hypothetical protein
MRTEIKELFTIIINSIEEYRNELAERPDVQKLSPKYQQGLQDGMLLIIKRLEATINE